MKDRTRIRVCSGEQLGDSDYLRIDVIYRGEPSSVIVFRYKGRCLAYRNLCVHMPRTLDCEKDMIFDETGQRLRCSMHGIVYNPVTGESLSTMCHGDKLTSVKVMEDTEGVWIVDKRVAPVGEVDVGDV